MGEHKQKGVTATGQLHSLEEMKKKGLTQGEYIGEEIGYLDS